MVANLKPELMARIERLRAVGSFSEADDIIEAGVRLLEEQLDRLEWLRAELLIADEQMSSGDLVPYSAETIDRRLEQARERTSRGSMISDAVRPPA